MKLAIVESPGKVKKIQQYLGSNYKVISCFGHFIDLPPQKLSVNIKKNFEATFSVLPDKKDIAATIRSKAKSCETVLLMMDGDREGEGMAHNIKEFLPKNVPTRELLRLTVPL